VFCLSYVFLKVNVSKSILQFSVLIKPFERVSPFFFSSKREYLLIFIGIIYVVQYNVPVLKF
jgi:hypothetical protein